MSIIVYLQQIGRSSRLYPGKKYNIIVDQCGNSIIHGHPLTRRNWTLDGIDKKTTGENIKMTVCTGCGALLSGRKKVCPYCGTILKIGAFLETEIKEVQAPMHILPSPAYSGYADIAEIEEYDILNREQAVIDRVRSGHMSTYGKFSELAKLIGKDDRWTDLVWRKYHENRN